MLYVEIAFWLVIGCIFYTLFLYPVLMFVASRLVRRNTEHDPIEPTVSLIIAAYNEEVSIAARLENALSLDYPREKLEIIVASDASTDRTDDIVRGFADRGVRLMRFEGRLGKTAMLNEAVRHAAGEIIAFSDATGTWNPQAIRALVRHFADPRVGCVTGRVTYKYGEDTTSRGFRFYQRWAVAIRRAESCWGSATSVSGSIHAMRRDLYRPAHPAFSLDVINAVHTVAAGYRVAYEYDALSHEHSRTRLADEFRCRVRIAIRTVSMVPYIIRSLLLTLRFRYLFQMTSHKFLRWGLWLLLIAAFTLNVGLVLSDHAGYRYLLLIQIAAYLFGLLALVAGALNVRLPGLSTLALFLLGNAALAVGFFLALFGRRMPRWEPVR